MGEDSHYKQLANALEAVEDALGIYDADDNLVAFNSHYARVRGAIGGKVYLGARWDDLILASLEAGTIAEALGREADWLRMRCRQRGAYSVLRALPDGTQYQVSEKRMPNGCIAVVWTDVTVRPAVPMDAAASPMLPDQLATLATAPALDPADLRGKVRWLRDQAAEAAPEHRETYLRIALECERLVHQSLMPPLRH